MLVALLALVVFLPVQQVNAQASNELIVQWANPDGTVKTDALRDAIANDVNRPANRVYKLLKGGFYWLTEEIKNDGWPLRIVGEEPGWSMYDSPAFIQMVARADGSVGGRMITGGGDITLKNVYIVGADGNGVQTYYQPIQIDASNSRFIFDNVILERSNFALIAFTAKNNDIFFTNCKFRNLIGQPSTQQWEGRGISIWADQDTVVVENCTFFNVGMTALQIEGGAANYLRFNHNTLVNLGRAVNTGNWFKQAYFANNLIVNGFWHGEGFADYSLIRNPSRDPRATTSGMFSIGALPTKYGPEEGRRIVFAKAAAWRDPAFAAFYGDTIRAQPFANPVTKLDFLQKYENMVVKDTMWLSVKPDIQTYPADIINSMIQNIKDLRAGSTPATPYFWKLPTDPYQPSWPLPENFYYTNNQLLTYGTNNMPLGDLNWFPIKKAEWETIKAKDIADIEALAGRVVVLNVVDTKEAEAGTLSGGAAVKELSGFAYFKMDGGGWIQWDFDLASAGQYDLNVWTHMRNNSQRGQRIIVNGVSIHDPFGWGEYIWGGTGNLWENMPKNEWTWTLIKQAEIKEADALTLKAGKNTIRIESSWGYQNFAGIDLKQGATVVKSLRAPDATSEIVSLIVEGAKWTPSGLRSVALGTNGTVTWQMTAPSDGKYRVQVLYQNPGTEQTGSIKADGTTVVTSLAFAPKLDSTGTAVLSSIFSLTKGAHTIALTGSGVNVDVGKLVQEISTSVESDELPTGFSLSQNYPNPFNPMTKIQYNIPRESKVSLKIYDILGRQVATLVDLRQGAGHYEINFDASKYASGVYIYRIIAGDFIQAKKMILMK